MSKTYSSAVSPLPLVELTVRQGPEAGQHFSLTKSIIVIGRDASNDIMLDHPEVSRRHASLTWNGAHFVIQDLGSSNGTFVNRRRLVFPQILQPGDDIGLGATVRLAFQEPASGSQEQTLVSTTPPAGARGGPATSKVNFVEPPVSEPSQRVAPPPPKRRRRGLIPLIALLGLGGLLVVAVLGYYLLRPGDDVSRPMVLIRSPYYGQQLAVGQPVTVHSIARDVGKVTRLELWVDGRLHQTQHSNLPGGSSPLPLLVRWQPDSPGPHTLIARAFNADGNHGQAAVNVEAIDPADGDNDRLADEADACPDEPGLPAANGCPDQDGDGIQDAADACPAEAGLPDGNGCPLASERDRDGDGLLDEADVCPDQPGSPQVEGCPDRDGDGVTDAEDVCPDELGLLEPDGCPLPADSEGDGVSDAADECPDEPGLPEHAGCPDTDGDGLRDRDDACPTEPGRPEHEGCPDRDGDGIQDAADACPDEPGPEPGGCPSILPGDHDGDGVADGADLSPDEPGPVDDGGVAPPAEDEVIEDLSDPIPLWPPPGGLFLDDVILMVPVELEALELNVSHEYDEVYCYVTVNDRDAERYGSFQPLGERQWDIAEYLGGENRRRIATPAAEPLTLTVECGGANVYLGPEGGWGTYWDMGSFTLEHPSTDWDGHVFTVRSEGGDDGRWFEAKYRLCADSCATAAYTPPLLTLIQLGPPWESDPYRQILTWRWEGDEDSINGFKLYVNGNFRTGFPANRRSYELHDSLLPACGERLEFQVSAYSGATLVPERESPRSNILVLAGPPCPRSMRVVFGDHTLITHDLCCEASPVGPVQGTLWANDQQISFDGSHLRWNGDFEGLWLESNTEYGIETQILHPIATWVDSCLGNGCPDYWAPWDNTLTTSVDANDDLTFGVRIYDTDREGEFFWRCIFAPWLPCWVWYETTEVACEAEMTIPAADLSPGIYTAYGDRCDLSVEIEEVEP